MKITYSAPNRSHHYPYAEAINRSGNLHAFISGFSRFSPIAQSVELGDKLKRFDLIQNLYLASLRLKSPFEITSFLTRTSAAWIDRNSYDWAKDSDAYIYYRTQGYKSTNRIHAEGRKTLCIMEEVNSHVDEMNELLKRGYSELGIGDYKMRIPDYKLRLKTYEAADYILCPSAFVKDSFVRKGFSPDKIITVNFGFPLADKILTESKELKLDGVFRVLFVGQIHYRKGLRYALEAFKNLKHPNKEFVIVGPKTLETGIEQISIPNNVRFTGPLKGEELKNQFRDADVFVLPSIEEGLALVQGEALVQGLPLIITTNTGGTDIIKNGVEGFIIPPFDSKILTDRLQELADDPHLRYKMSFNAISTANKLGSWDTAAERLINIINTKMMSHER